jgi:N-acetylneuraminic acid mutarotase
MKAIFLLQIFLLALHHQCMADYWTQKADFAGTPIGNAAGFTINGKCYLGTGSPVFGAGKSFWQYDPTTDTWTQKADFSGIGREGAASFSIDNRGYLGLGNDNDDKFLEDFWEYDPEINSWTQKGNFPGGKRTEAFSFTLSNKGYVGAGAATGFKEDFWEYEPATDTWTKKAKYGGGKVLAAAAFTIDDKAYVGTGRANTLEYLKDFWEYDPASNTWAQRADIGGDPRAGSVAFSINGLGYLGLGLTIDSSFADFWQYDPSTDNWIQKTDYPQGPTESAIAFSIDGYAYIGTGGGPQTTGIEFWQYTPDCIAPTNPNTSNITSASAKLKWDAMAGATKYKVQYKNDSTGAPWTAKTVNASNTSIVLNNLLAGTQYKWKVRSICGSENSAFSPVEKFTTQLKLAEEQAVETALSVFPNPFTHSSTVSFSSEEKSFIAIELYDASGRKAKTLIEAMLEPGHHEIPFRREQLSAGIYFLKLTNATAAETSKIIIE